MNVYKCWFILDRKLKKNFSSISRKRSVTYSRKLSNTCQFITFSLCLNPAVTWSVHYTFRNAWLGTSSLYSLAQPDKRPHLLIIWLQAVTYLWLTKHFETVYFVVEIIVTTLQCSAVFCLCTVRHIDCIRNLLYTSWAVWPSPSVFWRDNV